MAITVDYFISTSSPWTYLGSKLFTEMAAKAGATVNVYPVVFGEIFAVSGGLPLPKRAPQRQAYRMMELARWKRRRNAPLIVEPKNFPSTAAISSLAIIAAREAGHDALTLSNAVLAALWEDDRNIDDPAVIQAICGACGLDGAAIIVAAGKPKIAQMLKDDTQEAISRGVFGAPSYVIEKEIFWGQDRVDFVGEKLGIA
ncbi:MAG: 2-hydroxychromene-2-carboxylate isomerase [Alphaproteobacteria bacterium]|nr:2-hydroxychromene-2-carboxylate isomerase [Alphaproteobacteria bacterium]